MGRKLQYIEEKIDRNTGEVSTVKKTFAVKANSTEEFYITFLSGLNALCDLSRQGDIKVMAILCSIADYNTGKVSITSVERKEIIEKTGLSSPQAFTNAISRLKSQGLVTGEKGRYEINPHYFWKGTTDARNKMIKDNKLELIIKFKKDDAE